MMLLFANPMRAFAALLALAVPTVLTIAALVFAVSTSWRLWFNRPKKPPDK
jgi:hypothetical protein